MEIMKKILKTGNPRGFTLIEVISVLIIIGIIAVAVVSSVTSTSDIGRSAQESVIKNHIRYAQAAALKRGVICGIKCDGADYWMFTTNDPDTAANQIALPGEGNAKVTLAGKNVAMTAFTVFFDANGKPYTAYTDATTNTPVTAANPTITLDSVPAGSTATFNITPETGFIP
jgi:prepilin-type N-terminal cleavage/methylation domain-containing protein